MKREEFMRRLRAGLQGFPHGEASRVIEYFEEYWMDALESGRSEEEIAAGLDTPEAIVAQVRANFAFVSIEENPGIKSFWKVLGVVLLALFSIPVALPVAICVLAIAITVIAMVFALAVTVFALVFAGSALAVAGIFMMATGAGLAGLCVTGIGLIFFGLTLLCAVGMVAAVRAVLSAFARLFRWIYQKITGKSTNNMQYEGSVRR